MTNILTGALESHRARLCAECDRVLKQTNIIHQLDSDVKDCRRFTLFAPSH